jgi:hypothetical protein
VVTSSLKYVAGAGGGGWSFKVHGITCRHRSDSNIPSYVCASSGMRSYEMKRNGRHAAFLLRHASESGPSPAVVEVPTAYAKHACLPLRELPVLLLVARCSSTGSPRPSCCKKMETRESGFSGPERGSRARGAKSGQLLEQPSL